VSQTMQIELGLLGAVALMGIAIQLRVLAVLQRKLREIAAEQRKRDEEAEAHAAERFADVLKEREEWEKEHPTLAHGRNLSGHSHLPLMKDHDGSTTDEHNSTFTLVNGHRPRYQSGVSDFLAAAPPEEELKRAIRNSQNPGALPALDLGLGIQEDVPRDFISQDRSTSPKKDIASASVGQLDELKRKQELLAEIQTIRRSIDALKSESSSRHPSLSSSAALPGPSHLRPPRETDPRTRAQSMELHTLSYLNQSGEPISRPTSAPLRDNDWDSYVRDRKLLQPPSGVTQPIPTSRITVPPAVAEALTQRKRRESYLERGGGGEMGVETSSDDVPLATLPRHKKNSSTNLPVSILPPRRSSGIISPTPQRPVQSRTRTFEELSQRHREMMRDLQAPLSQAEKEHADIEAARSRWERSKALEKEAVTKRQAEKAAQVKEAEKKRKSIDELDRGGRKSTSTGNHSRSMSATLGTSSRRLSTLKVEDWQKYQQDLEMGTRNERVSSTNPKRDSRAGVIPFPEDSRHRDVEGRKAGYSRDPPN
jgi:hypothetical protein